MKGTKVSVIGLGAMGSALAKAFISKGAHVTVWNRNTEKVQAMVAKGATAAASAEDAIAASSLTVICVSDYKTADKILKNKAVENTLSGRTLVQLSTGTPKESREAAAWAQQHGAVLLNGDILAWPRQVGTDAATITFSGNEKAYNTHATTLKLLGSTSFLGEEPGQSSVLFAAVLAYLAGSWIGFVHGALIAENEGFPPEKFGELIHSVSPMLAEESKHMGRVIDQNKFSDPESTVDTTGHDLHLLVQHSREAGISSELPEFAASLFQRAIDAGYGKEEHAAIIKVLRKVS
ncbi:3-hydroxyisobutyrate dehydrogenase [Chitinophaga jiangningensis]|uniref:3-hydroxyisobutyrate dehydrogenase n=1 Tax=Chitinophaga jiangningensis TaxID=1419482 RepID=A0A1M6WKG6_9BACT|nr:NAD(P)-binding domain-containing protein [Chitinophaga jiangningensis]SHK94293.1 3-hydroxyisobutyrate dehydrogenase [Chitinophaga jiangningensis]